MTQEKKPRIRLSASFERVEVNFVAIGPLDPGASIQTATGRCDSPQKGWVDGRLDEHAFPGSCAAEDRRFEPLDDVDQRMNVLGVDRPAEVVEQTLDQSSSKAI